MVSHGALGWKGASQVLSLSVSYHFITCKFRNIGISNFNSQGLRDLMTFAKTKPSVLQVMGEEKFKELLNDLILKSIIV